MNFTLQTASLLTQTEAPVDPDKPLQTEYGWPEVGKGLTRILIGYFIAIIGTAAGIGVLTLAVYNQQLRVIPNANKNTLDLIIMLGGGLIALTSLFSYGFILAGKWRCLMNAPERHAAKWLIFACMLCLVIGPALNILTSMGDEGAKNYKQLRKVHEGTAEIRFDSVSGIMQLLGTVLSIVSTLVFVLFLRAVACCFNSRILLALIYLYLLYSALLLGITGQLFFASPKSLTRPDVVLALGFGWLLCGLGYLFVVFVTRICIARGTALIRSPLVA